nr:NAD(P)H-binding protein [Sphingomonas bacterium]
MRPTVLNDKPARGSVRTLTDLTGFKGGSIAREDVASFVVQQLTDGTWLRRAPLITW